MQIAFHSTRSERRENRRRPPDLDRLAELRLSDAPSGGFSHVCKTKRAKIVVK